MIHNIAYEHIRIDYTLTTSSTTIPIKQVLDRWYKNLQYAPTLILNTLVDYEFTTTTPTLEFTGSDIDSDDIRYNTQISNVSTFIENTEVLDDSYTVAHTTGKTLQTVWRFSQSYISNGGILKKATLKLWKNAVLSGNVYCKIYSHT